MVNEVNLLKNSISDLDWFQHNSQKLIENYEGNFIAIKLKEIVAFAPNIDILFKKLKDKHVNETEVLIEFISPKGQITIL